MEGHVSRVVALGASNLTRGFHTIVSTARDLWGPDVEVLAALGHGRSYGLPSSFLVRSLPGILQSGLWRDLESRPPSPTRALVTDVGNDIMNNHPPARILAWVDECAARLRAVTPDVTVTGLPHAAVAGLSNRRFLFFRSLFFPGCRMTLDEAVRAAAEVEAGLDNIASTRGISFVRMKAGWYGVDPIHIRPRMWRTAWQTILCGEHAAAPARRRWAGPEGIRLYCMQPEHASFFGRERQTPQHGVRLRAGGRVWLY